MLKPYGTGNGQIVYIATKSSVYYFKIMPLIEQSTYVPPFGFANPHVQSIFPQKFRHVTDLHYVRERISTPDNDFIDLDWCRTGGKRIVLLAHGLEGTTYRRYMKGMARAFLKRGWNTVSMNFRGCSGEPNRKLRSYHHGVSDDLYTVVNHVTTKEFDTIAIVGFSLGGNVLLKYLGEQLFPIPEQLTASVAISAPCDLTTCAAKMDQSQSFYTRRFIRMLHEKIKVKKHLFPEVLNDDNFNLITTFKQYDSRYTAPQHGFASALDYYNRCSSLPWLKSISSPVLLINAKDDPFLTPQCSPEDIARNSKSFYLETPDKGGHVGFITFNKDNEYWHETRAVTFIENIGK